MVVWVGCNLGSSSQSSDSHSLKQNKVLQKNFRLGPGPGLLFNIQYSPDVLEISPRLGNFLRDIVDLGRLVSVALSGTLSTSALVLLVSVVRPRTRVGAARVLCSHLGKLLKVSIVK